MGISRFLSLQVCKMWVIKSAYLITLPTPEKCVLTKHTHGRLGRGRMPSSVLLRSRDLNSAITLLTRHVVVICWPTAA